MKGNVAQQNPLTKARGFCTGAGNGIQTRGLNFGKVACYHYTIPAQNLLTKGIISDMQPIVKHFLEGLAFLFIFLFVSLLCFVIRFRLWVPFRINVRC